MLSHLTHWKTRGRIPETVFLLLCLVAAMALRLSFAIREPFWEGEAEASIEALSILENGHPTDHYLGIPIYNDVLLTASNDSQEYEFRSSNHSAGTVVDHGWLPLYSIAAALTLAGIHPDVDDGRPPTVRHGSQEFGKRAIVPRLPSLVFASLFLFFIYRLGRMISGGETAWSVLVMAAFAQPLVFFGWRAGDYSATLALSTLAGLTIWKLTHKGTWRDSMFAGLALMLLFHTQLLSFMIMSAVLLVNVPLALNLPRWKSKLLLTSLIVASGILPWWYWTNFFEASRRTPMAWSLLAFPSDFVFWFVTRKAFLGAIGLVIALAFLSAMFPRRRLIRRIVEAARDKQAFYFTLTWFVIAYLGFIFLSPAASFGSSQLMLLLAVPGYLLFALCATVAARAITPRFSIAFAPLVVLFFFGVRGAVVVNGPPPAVAGGLAAFVDVASGWTLERGTRIYAWPNENLFLMYASGLPVRSIAPVRKEFLDKYPDDLIFVETGTAYSQSALTEVQTIASKQGMTWNLDEARQAALRVQRFGARQYLKDLVANVWPPSEPIGPIDQLLVAYYTERTLLDGHATAEQYRLLHGFAPTNRMTSYLLPVYYWFVNPEKHLGAQLNYRDRIRGSTAIILPNGSIIFDGRNNRTVPLVDRAKYLAILRGSPTTGS